jgi:FAD-linked sulfhydryl oxidase
MILVTAVLLFLTFIMWMSLQDRSEDRLSGVPAALPKWMQKGNKQPEIPTIIPEVQTGTAIMGQLGNETLKEELGRAAWKLFHTTMARFPDKPTQDESDALKSYIHLFARLYPCGECATHFQGILEQFPPQTSSRSAAAVWACHVHNEVNKSKNKDIFDCSQIGDFYDCGCADDEKEAMSKAGEDSHEVAKTGKIGIEREGPTRGG